MRRNKSFILWLAFVTASLSFGIVAAQERTRTPQTPTTQSTPEPPSSTQPTATSDQGRDNTQNKDMQAKTSMNRVEAGKKQKITGVIVKRDADNFILRDQNGAETTVNLTATTKVAEKKSNPFRGGKNYATTSLLRGLNVEVEGRGENSGALVADKIKFTQDSFIVANSIESRVTPVEGRVGEAEGRLTQAEQNAQRLSGQIDELVTVANAANGGAKVAQETADKAIAGIATTNERISALDDYEAGKASTVNFKVASAVLSPESKTMLDEIANQAKTQKGFVIQVTGFASSDGNENYNRMLSQKRADSVVRYLVETHNIPLRRIITPFGYGELNPVADNTSRDGRQQNRRVEVAILVSKGISSSNQMDRSTETKANGTQGTSQNNVPPQQ